MNVREISFGNIILSNTPEKNVNLKKYTRFEKNLKLLLLIINFQCLVYDSKHFFSFSCLSVLPYYKKKECVEYNSVHHNKLCLSIKL